MDFLSLSILNHYDIDQGLYRLYRPIPRLYHRAVSDTSSKFVFAETDLATLKLVNLVPNTQYSLYATAVINVKDKTVESEPSETLIAWTDPAFPAFVEVRIVKARNNKFANFVSFSLRNYFVVRNLVSS